MDVPKVHYVLIDPNILVSIPCQTVWSMSIDQELGPVQSFFVGSSAAKLRVWQVWTELMPGRCRHVEIDAVFPRCFFKSPVCGGPWPRFFQAIFWESCLQIVDHLSAHVSIRAVPPSAVTHDLPPQRGHLAVSSSENGGTPSSLDGLSWKIPNLKWDDWGVPPFMEIPTSGMAQDPPRLSRHHPISSNLEARKRFSCGPLPRFFFTVFPKSQHNSNVRFHSCFQGSRWCFPPYSFQVSTFSILRVAINDIEKKGQVCTRCDGRNEIGWYSIGIWGGRSTT